MTWRAFLLALVLVPLQAFWTIHMELVRGGIWPTVLSLLFTVVFLVFVVALANQALRRWLPRLALGQHELLALYILLATGSSLCGCDVGQTWVHILGAPYRFATASNRWAERLGPYLPEPLLVHEEAALKDFYRGASSLYAWDHLRWWLGPGLGWLWFIAGMLCAMLGLALLVRRQWIGAERLSFPIVQVPLALTTDRGFFADRRLWWGFALAGAINLLNGLHALVPGVPTINCKQAVQLGPMFTTMPWRALGWLPLTFYPFAIGLGFLMPLEMSCSCVVGFWMWKAQRVAGTAWGYPPQSWLTAAWGNEQVAGVWLAVVAASLWAGRRAWRRMVLAREARLPLGLLAVGATIMVTFGHQAGMTWGFALAYFGLYLGFSLALSRMRAEFGPPCHDLYGAGPDRIFVTWLGAGALGPRNLTATAVFYWLSRESARSHPMPHQIEGLYLGSERLPLRRLVPAMLAMGVLSGVVTLWVTLHYGYVHGSEGGFGGPATWFATEGFRRLDGWLDKPPLPNPGGRVAMVVALVLSLLALLARSRLLWFTFHPAGYAISSYWAIHLLWFPLLLAWVIKRNVIRFGGARAYQAWRPFFFGLVLGEFVVGSLWQIAGLLGGFTAYAFWI
jgi:hypothetical protein